MHLLYDPNWLQPFIDQGFAELEEYLAKWAVMYELGGAF
jgi:hypothetical protein